MHTNVWACGGWLQMRYKPTYEKLTRALSVEVATGHSHVHFVHVLNSESESNMSCMTQLVCVLSDKVVGIPCIIIRLKGLWLTRQTAGHVGATQRWCKTHPKQIGCKPVLIGRTPIS